MSQDQNSQFLGKERISKLMLKFSIPCVLSLPVIVKIVVSKILIFLVTFHQVC